jgi:outer membrane protein
MKYKMPILLASFLLIVIASVFLIIKYNEKKIVVVRTTDLFVQFEYTKELDEKFEQIKNIRQAKLDSLEGVLKAIRNSVKDVNKLPDSLKFKFNLFLEQFKKDQIRYKEDNENSEIKFQKQIWTQLNQFTVDYAKENNYDIVVGANAQGSVMFVKDNIDITVDLIKYCNEKHKGH